MKTVGIAARLLSLSLITILNIAGLLFELLTAPRREWKRAVGRSLTRSCERLGPVFIKIGQMLSSRPDLLPVEIVAELSKLQEQVKPFPRRMLRRALAEAYGERVPPFADFAEEPISTGSVAQVYRAVLHSGEVVAVKLRRPGLDAMIERDLAIITAVSRFFAALPSMRLVPIDKLLAEISMLIRGQLDLQQEGANIDLFLAAFRGNRFIIIPRVHKDLTTERALVMEFMEDLIRIPQHRFVSEAKHTIIEALRGFFQMVFEDGRVHADLHPGNIFLRRDGSFVLLDFGVVATLGPVLRWDFRDFFFGLITNNGQRCARVLHDHALYRTRAYDYAAFERKIISLIGKNSSLCAGEFEVTRFAADLFAVQRAAGLRGSTAFATIILAFILFEGMVKQIDPGLDFQAEALWYLARQSRKAAYA